MKKLLVTTLVAASAFAVSACHSDGTGNTYFYDRDGKGNIRISDKEATPFIWDAPCEKTVYHRVATGNRRGNVTIPMPGEDKPYQTRYVYQGDK
ncbi:MAG: hypothetical protein COV36_03070 [Alphaproteobacteria bacterium CG11_big_fil_rev_8_21_14_0_20_44_7]|nr:MAG: hypothetical protein COV36_03070 [Alphaproteobacteria bacterium CG11_big_fil_rev_8_21_14_0_20_44_7]